MVGASGPSGVPRPPQSQHRTTMSSTTVNSALSEQTRTACISYIRRMIREAGSLIVCLWTFNEFEGDSSCVLSFDGGGCLPSPPESPGWRVKFWPNRPLQGYRAFDTDSVIALSRGEHDDAGTENLREYLRAHGSHYAASIPLRAAGEYKGFVVLGFDSHPKFDASQRKRLQTLASAIAVAIQTDSEGGLNNLLALGKSGEAPEYQPSANRLVQHCLASLVTGVEVDVFLAKVLRVLMAQLDADEGSIWTMDDSALAQRICISGLVTLTPVQMQQQVELPATSIAARRLLKEHLAIWPVDVLRSCGRPAETALANMLSGRGIRTVMTIPLISGGVCNGTIALRFRREMRIEQAQEGLAYAMANQAAVAIQMSDIQKERAEQIRRHAVLQERARLAGEVHDGIAQTFTALQRLLVGKTDLDDQARSLCLHGLIECRRAIEALRPADFDADDLAEALVLLVERHKSGPVSLHLHVAGDLRLLTKDQQVQVYRIAQEAINNVLKHSGAFSAEISAVVQDGEFSLLVKDDGIGFDPSVRTAKYGLESMSRRAASIGADLVLASPAEGGAQVFVSFKTGA